MDLRTVAAGQLTAVLRKVLARLVSISKAVEYAILQTLVRASSIT